MAVCLCVLALENFLLGFMGTSDAFFYGPLILRSVFKNLIKLLFWVHSRDNTQMLTASQILRVI